MITLPLLAALALQLPGTDPLVPVADFSAEMVEGIDVETLRALTGAPLHVPAAPGRLSPPAGL